jgi:hypothetical protein
MPVKVLQRATRKHPLDLSGEFHVLKKVVTLLLNCFGELFPLSDVPLDDPNNKGETQRRGEIVEDPKPRVDMPPAKRRGAVDRWRAAIRHGICTCTGAPSVVPVAGTITR